MYVALGQTIPWQCWDAPGFKACHAKQESVSRANCESAPEEYLAEVYGGDVKRCITELTYARTRESCFGICPSTTPTQPIPTPDQGEISQQEEFEETRSFRTPILIGGAFLLGAVVVVLARRT